jgi:hypothetical protein
MHRHEARKIAEKITDAQIHDLLVTARKNITKWSDPSRINKTMSRGVVFNIINGAVDNTDPKAVRVSVLIKQNIIREFGEYLPDNLKIDKKKRADNTAPYHEDPKPYPRIKKKGVSN